MQEDNKTIVRRVFEEVWNDRRTDLIDELIAPDHNYIDPNSPDFGRGPEGFRKLVNYYVAAFPDCQFTLHDIIAEGDRVAIIWTARGSQRGDLQGIPATGKQVTVTGINICRVSQGKIAEQRNNFDALGMMQQLGVVPVQAARKAAR